MGLPRSNGEAPVGEFQFQRADILLTHNKGSFFGWLIRFGTRSYWNHAVLVYVIPSETDGFSNTFVIESLGQGIDIRNITQYLNHPKQFDIGIKRLKADWNGDGTNDEAVRYARLVRGFALQEIDDRYSWGAIAFIAMRTIALFIQGIALRLQDLITWLLKGILGLGTLLAHLLDVLAHLLLPHFQAPDRRLAARARGVSPPTWNIGQGLRVNQYICSGFVQWAYYQAMQILKNSPAPPSGIDDSQIIFNPRAKPPYEEKLLLATTPGELADTDKLAWQCIIKGGRLYPVSPQQQAKAVKRLLKGKEKASYKYKFERGRLIMSNP